MMRILILAAFAACGAPAPASKPGPATTGDRTSCAAASDCALVETCCGCTAGGDRIAIRADAVAAYEAERPARCGGRMCPQVMSTHSSCTAEAGCEAGRCAVLAHLRDE
jgi:hypothetical protein